MKRKLIYAFAASIFTLTLIGTPAKAHASADMYLTLDGGGGDSGGSGGSGHSLTWWDGVKILLGLE